MLFFFAHTSIYFSTNLNEKLTFFSTKFKAHFSSILIIVLPMWLIVAWIVWMQKRMDYGPAYMCSDPQHCFPVALTDCTWIRPWKAALTTSHPWANQKAVQNNGLLLPSCHLRGRCSGERNTMGVCLDMTMAATPSPLAMEDDTGEGESTQKQVQSAPEKRL